MVLDSDAPRQRLIDYTGLLLFLLGAITLINSPLRVLRVSGGIWVGGFLVGFGLAAMGYCRAYELAAEYLG